MKSDMSAIAGGSIVSCYFPLTEKPDEPGPVARPALIVKTFFDRTEGIWKAAVAYGTSRTSRANAGFEIRITREEGIARAGLHRATRFTLSRMRILPLNDAFFACLDGTPVLGHLDEGLVQRLDQTLGILAEIAAPLRPLCLLDHAETTSTQQRWQQHHIPPPTRRTSTISGYGIDAFMKEHLTGRANLNGMR